MHYMFQSSILTVLLMAGCSAPEVKAPIPSTDVSKQQAWRDAEKVTARGDGRSTVIGAGDSMRPIYGDHTVLVLSKIDYGQLKSGMQVAYVSRSEVRVVHVLLEKDGVGWRVKGLNNENEDRERVTPNNLIGVVYASFATEQNAD